MTYHLDGPDFINHILHMNKIEVLEGPIRWVVCGCAFTAEALNLFTMSDDITATIKMTGRPFPGEQYVIPTASEEMVSLVAATCPDCLKVYTNIEGEATIKKAIPEPGEWRTGNPPPGYVCWLYILSGPHQDMAMGYWDGVKWRMMPWHDANGAPMDLEEVGDKGFWWAPAFYAGGYDKIANCDDATIPPDYTPMTGRLHPSCHYDHYNHWRYHMIRIINRVRETKPTDKETRWP